MAHIVRGRGVVAGKEEREEIFRVIEKTEDGGFNPISLVSVVLRSEVSIRLRYNETQDRDGIPLNNTTTVMAEGRQCTTVGEAEDRSK